MPTDSSGQPWHPSTPELLAWYRHRLDADDHARIERHWDDCRECASRCDLILDSQAKWVREAADHFKADIIFNAETGNSVVRYAHFELLERLGAGTMGTVYKARRIGGKFPIALKIIELPESHRELTEDQSDRERYFKREIENLTKLIDLNNDHVVRIRDVRLDDRCIEMELLPGVTLAERLNPDREDYRVLETRDALRIAAETLDGLTAVHRRGVIHRDVKPGNIFLREESDQAVLLDFSISASVEAKHRTERTGTRAYMSPDQVDGKHNTRNDIFSLGITLWEMLTGTTSRDWMEPTRPQTDQTGSPAIEIPIPPPEPDQTLGAAVVSCMCDLKDWPPDQIQDNEFIPGCLDSSNELQASLDSAWSFVDSIRYLTPEKRKRKDDPRWFCVVRDPVAGKDTSMLLLHPSHRADHLARFRRDILVRSKLESDAIIRSRHDDPRIAYFMADDFLDGNTAENAIREQQSEFSFQQVLRIGQDLALGLQAAHTHGIVHGELRPANVWIGGNMRAKLFDFGSATDRGNPCVADDGFDELFTAPERLNGEPASVASDIFGLGRVLIALATGRLNLDAEAVFQLRQLPQEFLRWILCMCDRDPAARPDSANEVYDYLCTINESTHRLPEG